MAAHVTTPCIAWLTAGHVVINDKFYEASSGNILDEICEWQQLHT
jgi:hypothetical protein